MCVRRALPAGRLDARNDTLIPGRILGYVPLLWTVKARSLIVQIEYLVLQDPYFGRMSKAAIS